MRLGTLCTVPSGFDFLISLLFAAIDETRTRELPCRADAMQSKATTELSMAVDRPPHLCRADTSRGKAEEECPVGHDP